MTKPLTIYLLVFITTVGGGIRDLTLIRGSETNEWVGDKVSCSEEMQRND
jgi:hypothetical protein